MALFPKRTPKPTASSHGRPVRATGAGTGSATPIGSLSAAVGAGRERAMALPTISRGRDLLASLIGSLPIRQYGTGWDGENIVEIPLPPEPWMLRPELRTTRAHTLAWTFDDLLFHGRAYWYVTKRYAPNGDRPVGFPAEFQWLPAYMVSMVAAMYAGNVPIGEYQLTFNGQPIPTRDVIVFYSPNSPLLDVGARAIITAERLDRASQRFATTPAAFGWLEQTEGDLLDDEYLSDVAQGWQDARDSDAIAALGRGWKWHESDMDPSKLQLTEARQHQALELARLVNVHPALVGAPTGSGMTYNNVRDARQQLAQDALPYIEVIEQTLSSDAVTPRGRIVKLDRTAWTSDPLDMATNQPTPQESTV